MKTIVHYISGTYLPITETWIYEQIKNLRKYKPIVYCHNIENLDIYPTKKIRSFKLMTGIGNLGNFFNKGWNKIFGFHPGFLFGLIKDKPNLVHAHFGPSGYNFLKLKGMFKLHLITTFYGYDLSELPHQYPEWKIKYKELFREGEIFLGEGNYMRRSLIRLGCSPKKIIVQHLGINLDEIKFVSRKLDVDGTVHILIAGTFTEKKGIPYAIETFARVRKKYKNLQLTIIGDSTGKPEGEKEKRTILAKINKYHLHNHIRLLGYQPHSIFIKELYNHHIFLSPSIRASNNDTEGGAPVSIIEASASGMPILSTIHCDIPEVVINKKSGYLVPERDVGALTEKLEFLVSNPNLWKQMGQKGREHIEKNYDAKLQAQKLEKIYDKVIKK